MAQRVEVILEDDYDGGTGAGNRRSNGLCRRLGTESRLLQVREIPTNPALLESRSAANSSASGGASAMFGGMQKGAADGLLKRRIGDE